VDKRRYSNIVDIRCFRGANCDTDHYLVVTNVRQRLSVSKQAAQKFDAERLNQKKNYVEGKERYPVKISNRFAALENLVGGVYINRDWESIRENLKPSTMESLGC
jgi:hypothetical protein